MIVIEKQTYTLIEKSEIAPQNSLWFWWAAKSNIGLGLTICYDIVVQEHGGTIHLDTQEGEYTHVRIRIPHRDSPPIETDVDEQETM